MGIEKKIPIIDEATDQTRGCQGCKSDEKFDIEFEFAFQPIVNIATRSVFAREALIRGPNGESAYSILSQVTDLNRYQFDQACRVKAVKTAAATRATCLSFTGLPTRICFARPSSPTSAPRTASACG